MRKYFIIDHELKEQIFGQNAQGDKWTWRKLPESKSDQLMNIDSYVANVLIIDRYETIGINYEMNERWNSTSIIRHRGNSRLIDFISK